MELTRLLGDAGLTLAIDILRIQGQLRYLADWDRDIVTTLARRDLPTPPIVTRPARTTGELAEHRLIVRQTPPGTQRRFDYESCERREPALYHRHVVLTPPAARLSLTFPASEVWQGLRSEGWQREAALPDNQRRRAPEIFMPRDQARYLSDIRLRTNALGKQEKAARQELSRLISVEEAERDLKDLRGLGYGGATMRIAKAKPTRKIDMDLAQSDPRLSPFVSVSPTKGGVRAEFVLVQPDPEGDKQDENAWGIWKD